MEGMYTVLTSKWDGQLINVKFNMTEKKQHSIIELKDVFSDFQIWGMASENRWAHKIEE